jgi:myo-inositol-1(or 4)-monophosphatase
LQSAVLSYGLPFSTKGDPGHCLRHFADVASKGAQLLRMGSAALNMAYVAAGRFDGFMESASFPWDVAAGVILVEEAGGTVTNYDGSHYQLKKPGILATNGDIHSELLAVIKRSQ